MPVDPAKETAKWKASYAWTDVVTTVRGEAIMPLSVFERLDDYSCTLPSGVYIGKRWRCRRPYVNQSDGSNEWFMGEYAEDPDPEQAAIIWREIWIRREDASPERATNALINARKVEKALA